MKALTFTFLSLLFAFTLSAQVVIVNSPASLQGAYVFETGDFGADVTTNVWTGDGIIADDGSDLPTEGCGDAVIDYTGKIALVDRGSCQFGTKCLNANLAGAIGVIIINNQPGGPVPMAGGDDGAMVGDTIPCVMIGLEDGAAIKEAVMNGGANITIGALQFGNDLAVTASTILVPNTGTIPVDQIADAGSAVAPVGALVINRGFNDATNINLAATITSGGSEVYNEMTTVNLLMTDDTTDVVPLADFDYSGATAGTSYDITYAITSDSIDQLNFDDAASNTFNVTSNSYCRGGWDFDNNRPARTNAYTPSGGGAVEFTTGFTVNKGMGYQIDAATFYVATDVETLEDFTVELNLYEWLDADVNGFVNEGELTRVAFNSVLFDATNVDPDAPDAAWVTLPFLTFPTLTEGYQMPVDGGQYFIGIRYTGDQTVFFGFDEGYDLTVAVDGDLVTTSTEYPYIGTTTFEDNMPPDINLDQDTGGTGFLFEGLRGTLAVSMDLSAVNNTNDVLAADAATLTMFPNPTADVLNVQLELATPTADLSYTIVDATGKLVYSTSKNNITTDVIEVNVASYPAGQYFMTINTDQGIRTQNFTVSH